MARSWIGLAVLGLVILVAVGVSALGGLDGVRRAGAPEQTTVSLYFGGEKARFLRNPDVLRIFERRYGVTLDARRAGSIEMATTLPVAGIDCLWPSNEVAVALARRSGRTVLSDETIFTSPIVFFAWDAAADALVAQGAVAARPDGFLGADLGALASLIEGGARWREDLGVEVYGPFRVLSTDPTKSNSGSIWSALLATAFNDGATPTADRMATLAPQVTAYFAGLGFMEDSSGDIFENFLKQGMSARPIIVGYENQLVEFLIENAELADLIRDRIRVAYPAPTIFASHPLISLTARCGRLAEALRDPEVQDIAWTAHGFRTGVIGVQNDPADLVVARLPERVGQVAPMPSAEAMTRLLAALRGAG